MTDLYPTSETLWYSELEKTRKDCISRLVLRTILGLIDYAPVSYTTYEFTLDKDVPYLSIRDYLSVDVGLIVGEATLRGEEDFEKSGIDLKMFYQWFKEPTGFLLNGKAYQTHEIKRATLLNHLDAIDDLLKADRRITPGSVLANCL